MTGMSDSTRRARQIELAVRLASERYRARRARIDAVEGKANVGSGARASRWRTRRFQPHWRMRRRERYWPKL